MHRRRRSRPLLAGCMRRNASGSIAMQHTVTSCAVALGTDALMSLDEPRDLAQLIGEVDRSLFRRIAVAKDLAVEHADRERTVSVVCSLGDVRPSSQAVVCDSSRASRL